MTDQNNSANPFSSNPSQSSPMTPSYVDQYSPQVTPSPSTSTSTSTSTPTPAAMPSSVPAAPSFQSSSPFGSRPQAAASQQGAQPTISPFAKVAQGSAFSDSDRVDSSMAKLPTQPQVVDSLSQLDEKSFDDDSFDVPDDSGSQTPTAVSATGAAEVSSESLEDQNIFELLGVNSVTEQEKEAFLDELQQVIWEDFLENDVELLLTTEEMAGLKQLMGDKPKNDLDLQEQVITYLEKFIPDLEEVMLEKALELKEDMVRERLSGLREYFAGQADKLTALDKAESLMSQAQWHQAADTMNRLAT